VAVVGRDPRTSGEFLEGRGSWPAWPAPAWTCLRLGVIPHARGRVPNGRARRRVRRDAVGPATTPPPDQRDQVLRARGGLKLPDAAEDEIERRLAAVSSATGSSATGSSATGSSATGSSATGSSATGSSATGSSATGACRGRPAGAWLRPGDGCIAGSANATSTTCCPTLPGSGDGAPLAGVAGWWSTARHGSRLRHRAADACAERVPRSSPSARSPMGTTSTRACGLDEPGRG